MASEPRNRSSGRRSNWSPKTTDTGLGLGMKLVKFMVGLRKVSSACLAANRPRVAGRTVQMCILRAGYNVGGRWGIGFDFSGTGLWPVQARHRPEACATRQSQQFLCWHRRDAALLNAFAKRRMLPSPAWGEVGEFEPGEGASPPWADDRPSPNPLPQGGRGAEGRGEDSTEQRDACASSAAPRRCSVGSSRGSRGCLVFSPTDWERSPGKRSNRSLQPERLGDARLSQPFWLPDHYHRVPGFVFSPSD